jgi:hypothetical protein
LGRAWHGQALIWVQVIFTNSYRGSGVATEYSTGLYYLEIIKISFGWGSSNNIRLFVKFDIPAISCTVYKIVIIKAFSRCRPGLARHPAQILHNGRRW